MAVIVINYSEDEAEYGTVSATPQTEKKEEKKQVTYDEVYEDLQLQIVEN